MLKMLTQESDNGTQTQSFCKIIDEFKAQITAEKVVTACHKHRWGAVKTQVFVDPIVFCVIADCRKWSKRIRSRKGRSRGI